jgi:chondroitin AC lyase
MTASTHQSVHAHNAFRIALVAVAATLSTHSTASPAAADTAAVGKENPPETLVELNLIKARILAPLAEPIDAAAVGRLIDSLGEDGSWPEVDYGDQRRSAWTTSGHLSNVLLLARAYRSPHSKLAANDKLQGALGRSLDYWLRHDFQNSNWWWNQIGVPRTLAPILLLIDDELTGSQRSKGLEILRRARIGMTGQNLVWVTEITALRGILEQDRELVAAAYRRIAEEIRVGAGEGIQPDFSFHQHGPCLYSHGYGAAFAVDCSRIATQVAGTSLAFPPEKIAILSRMLLDGSQWMARGAASDFGAEGREITRKGQNVRYLATAAENMLQLPSGREAEFRALQARASDRPAPPLEGNRHFWCSDIMTHHRPNYYTSARMFSNRIANTDDPCNSEGLKSHHVADGCNLVLRAGNEYRDVFPVWDWQKVPGATVEQKPQLIGSPRSQGERSFVGGVSDGGYGMAALDLARDALAARKSWFFFDQEVVCLGAGITCGSNNPVLTTLNQCNLQGDVLIQEPAGDRKLEPGDHALEHPAWLWHDRLAYVFLQPAAVRLQNGSQSGSWWEINHQYAKQELARKIFTAWIDHGAGPKDASYAYLVVPDVDPASVEPYASRPPVRILANRAAFQAVWHETLRIAAAAFYQPGALEIHPGLEIAVTEPCLTLLHESPGKLVVWMSNPENKQATVVMEVTGAWAGEGVEILNDRQRSRVAFPLPGGAAAGSSLSRTLVRP